MHPSEVANVILQAVTSNNPDFRYVVGKDAAISLEARRNMSDVEFENLMKNQLNLSIEAEDKTPLSIMTIVKAFRIKSERFKIL